MNDDNDPDPEDSGIIMIVSMLVYTVVLLWFFCSSYLLSS